MTPMKPVEPSVALLVKSGPHLRLKPLVRLGSTRPPRGKAVRLVGSWLAGWSIIAALVVMIQHL